MISRVVIPALVVTVLFVYMSKAERAPKLNVNPVPRSESARSQYVEIEGKEYFVSKRESLTWYDSKTMCEDEHNMTLVVIETEQENMALMDYFQNVAPELDFWRWTSGYRAKGSEEWKWNTTGEPLTFLGWGLEQPSTSTDIEGCMNFLALVEGWDDDECDGFLMSYMCEAAEEV